MISRDEAESLLADGGHLLTCSGEDLGPVARVFLDEYTGWPSFATVATSFERVENFVALHEAELVGRDVQVPYGREKVAGAPQVGDGRDLTIEEEDGLFDYYGVPIDGVLPSVAHLGSVLVTDGKDDVTERETDHDSS